jgi:hypothetical protein
MQQNNFKLMQKLPRFLPSNFFHLFLRRFQPFFTIWITILRFQLEPIGAMMWRARNFCQRVVRSVMKTSGIYALPSKSKEITKCQNADYSVGACSMQG